MAMLSCLAICASVAVGAIATTIALRRGKCVPQKKYSPKRKAVRMTKARPLVGDTEGHAADETDAESLETSPRTPAVRLPPLPGHIAPLPQRRAPARRKFPSFEKIVLEGKEEYAQAQLKKIESENRKRGYRSAHSKKPAPASWSGFM